jgi:hypothetical protein
MLIEPHAPAWKRLYTNRQPDPPSASPASVSKSLFFPDPADRAEIVLVLHDGPVHSNCFA